MAVYVIMYELEIGKGSVVVKTLFRVADLITEGLELKGRDMMTEKSVYRMSEVLASGCKGSPFRLALIHFTEMTDAERRSELEAIRSLTAINAGEKQKVLTLLGKFSALNGENRRGLASQLREDYRQDLLAEQI
jgi:hypothetical protein